MAKPKLYNIFFRYLPLSYLLKQIVIFTQNFGMLYDSMIKI